MTAKVNFAFALHNHQPVGNFDKVIESAFRNAYQPFLDVLERHPSIRIGLHVSGCLLEWLETHHPEYIERLRRIVAEGRIELIGGGFFEPIFPMLPERDRVGQIRAFSKYLKSHFGAVPIGMWLPERVWEQALVKSFVDAGARYTVLDDFHFKCAGLQGHELGGYYVTEDEGRVFCVFPISEELRYAIPFKEPERTLDVLRRFARPDASALVVYADDGEKFGVWPKTKKHVYDNGWLERFFSVIEANMDWVNLVTFSEALQQLKPVGKIYLPDCSYREMTEWALPTSAQEARDGLLEELRREGRLERYAPFLRGGIWRNFRSKYRESNLMCAKMWHVSNLVADVPTSKKEAAAARMDLYRGQCNCGYWHGVFGGLYLPHLRDTIYRRLISAETLAIRAKHGKKAPLRSEEQDLDMDGHKEVFVSNGLLNCYLAPARGGHMFEFDIVQKRFNAMNTLTRRREAYHNKVKTARVISDIDQVETIHNLVLAKQPGLEAALQYDWYERESLVDHFIAAETTLQQFSEARYSEEGDFVNGQYSLNLDCDRNSVSAILQRRGHVARVGAYWPVVIEKSVKLSRNVPAIEVRYRLYNEADNPLQCRFGIEFNFSMLAADSGDRYCYWRRPPNPPRHSKSGTSVQTDRQHTSLLNTHNDIEATALFGIVDRWQKLEIELRFKQQVRVWTFPIQTVSQSEAGFELVYQSTAVMPIWTLSLTPREWMTLDLVLAVNDLEK